MAHSTDRAADVDHWLAKVGDSYLRLQQLVEMRAPPVLVNRERAMLDRFSARALAARAGGPEPEDQIEDSYDLGGEGGGG